MGSKELPEMLEFIEEQSRKTEVASKHDVIVAGGGTAGVTAAIASARQGVDTLLIEQFGYLGGSQTAALVTPMMAIMPGRTSGTLNSVSCRAKYARSSFSTASR